MRITGGIAKGQLLKLPKNYDIRPTTDMIREAIFSILASMDSDWIRVLDLFAGTGALGIEALSRGVQWVDFVDREPRCCAIIKQNLVKMGLLGKAHIYCSSVSKAFNFLEGEYSLIFLDPPYANTTIPDMLIQMDKSDYMAENALMVIPHSSRTGLAEKYGGLSLVKKRQHGDTCISIYRKEVGI